MDNEKLINFWRKRCLKGGNTPIALICVNKDGFPVVFSHHESKVLNEVYKHLANTDVLGESTHIEDREN